MSEYNDIDHRAFWGLLPGCDQKTGGIKDIEVLTGTILWPTKRKKKDGHPIAKSWIDESEKVSNVNHTVTFKIPAPSELPDFLAANKMFMQMAANRGDKFIMDRLLKDYNVNTMPCPTCGMRCDKTREGYFQRIKYEYFKCHKCNKHFKITL